MTTFDTRSPLQALSMVSSQRPPRRRSAQNAFDDEDAPPAKRAKIDGASAAGQEKSQMNGHKSSTDGRRKKPCKCSQRRWSSAVHIQIIPLPHRLDWQISSNFLSDL